MGLIKNLTGRLLPPSKQRMYLALLRLERRECTLDDQIILRDYPERIELLIKNYESSEHLHNLYNRFLLDDDLLVKSESFDIVSVVASSYSSVSRASYVSKDSSLESSLENRKRLSKKNLNTFHFVFYSLLAGAGAAWLTYQAFQAIDKVEKVKYDRNSEPQYTIIEDIEKNELYK